MTHTEDVDAAIERACTAVLNVAGEHFPCDWPVDVSGHHEGWGHANKAAQAVWSGDDTEATTARVRVNRV